MALKKKGIFEVISGILVGKPQDVAYYEEYKAIYREVINNSSLPIVYNVNFGHAQPRCVIPYRIKVKVDMREKIIRFTEPLFR